MLVLSIPKSGTYLAAEVLRQMGMEFTGYHIHEAHYEDYSGADLETARLHPRRFRVVQPMENVIAGLQRQQFAVGHLKCTERALNAMEGIPLLFLKRELRRCLVSQYRWYQSKGVSIPLVSHNAIRHATAMCDWNERADGVVCFEDLISEKRDAQEALSIATGMKCTRTHIQRALTARTLTKMPDRTELEGIWTNQSERVFRQFGGHEVNRMLGYDA